MSGWIRNFITRESVLLSALLVLGLAGWGFLELQDEVMEGDTVELDERLLRLFRDAEDPGSVRGPDWLEYVARDVTALGGTATLVLLTVAVAGYFLLRRQTRPMLLMLITVIGGTLLMSVLKNLYGRARPDLVPHLMEEHSHSFPSGHSTMATVVYLTLAVMVAEFQRQRSVRVYIVGFAALIAALVGLSRVIMGVHYPTDVAAGWSLGVCWATLAWVVARLLKRHEPDLERSLEDDDPKNGYGDQNGTSSPGSLP